MTDEVDLGNEIMEQNIARAVHNIVSQNQGESLKYCIDCDEEIPQLRREKVKGCKRCVTCQEVFDKKSKHIAQR